MGPSTGYAHCLVSVGFSTDCTSVSQLWWANLEAYFWNQTPLGLTPTIYQQCDLGQIKYFLSLNSCMYKVERGMLGCILYVVGKSKLLNLLTYVNCLGTSKAEEMQLTIITAFIILKRRTLEAWELNRKMLSFARPILGPHFSLLMRSHRGPPVQLLLRH